MFTSYILCHFVNRNVEDKKIVDFSKSIKIIIPTFLDNGYDVVKGNRLKFS